MNVKPAIRAALLLIPASFLFFGAETYQQPPKEIMDILNAPTTPTLALSPSGAYAMQGSPVRFPPIAELAEPMLRLAGIRINPKTNGLHNDTFNTNLTLRKIPEGTEIKVMTPPNSRLSMPRWSPDGTHFAFTNSTSAGTELWIGDSATGRTHKLPNLRINAVLGAAGGGRGGGTIGPVQWMPDGKSLRFTWSSPIVERPLRSLSRPPARMCRKAWAADAEWLRMKTCSRIRMTKIFSSFMPHRNWRWWTASAESFPPSASPRW
jgi:hypothetical protein